MGPPAGDGTELQFTFAPFHAPELAGLNLVFQILCGLEQRGFQRVVFGLGVEGRTMNPPRTFARMAGGLGVRARSRYFQPHLDAEGRFGLPLVFEDHFGGGDRRQAMQVFELLLHLAVPGRLGVEADIAKGGFHVRFTTDRGFDGRAASSHGVLYGEGERRRPREDGRNARPPTRPA